MKSGLLGCFQLVLAFLALIGALVLLGMAAHIAWLAVTDGWKVV